MTSLQHTSKIIKSNEEIKKEQLEHTETLKNIRKKEREQVLNELFHRTILKHKRYMKNLNKYIIFQDDLKQIIEELKGEE